MKIDEAKTIVTKIQDEAVRTEVLSVVDALNKDRGEFGNKLIIKDQEIDALKKRAAELEAQVSKAKPDEKLKDLDPVVAQTLAELKKRDEDREAELKQIRTQNKMDKALKKAIEGFKDDKGNLITVADHFIDKTSLYAVSDLSNEILLEEVAKKVLVEAAAKQSEIMKQLGYQGGPVHLIPEGGDKAKSMTTAPDFQKIIKEQGVEAAFAAKLAWEKNNK